VVVAAAGAGVAALAGHIPRGDDLAGGAELLMVEVEAVVHHGDDRPGAVAEGPGRLHLGVGIDEPAVDGGGFEMPLGREGLATLAAGAHQFRMAQGDALLAQQGSATWNTASPLLPGAATK
jgi:hypothetical protein